MELDEIFKTYRESFEIAVAGGELDPFFGANIEAKQALYQRLAAEAELVTYSKDQININIQALPISKLKAIMEIKE